MPTVSLMSFIYVIGGTFAFFALLYGVSRYYNDRALKRSFEEVGIDPDSDDTEQVQS